ncbi:MAG: hypothetical protein EWV74_12095 [Microcystis wesenbergii Mw_QC_S_20081001_S30]|nr:MAG: hypothetical protein EWV74_12095 [Microcystis wesenbergii Mw_QC_S_20081001_S30]
MTTSKWLKPHTPHPTPHTLPPRKTFCRKPYVKPGNPLAFHHFYLLKRQLRIFAFMLVSHLR